MCLTYCLYKGQMDAQAMRPWVKLFSFLDFHLSNEDNNNIHLIRLLGGFSEIIYINCLEQPGIYE